MKNEIKISNIIIISLIAISFCSLSLSIFRIFGGYSVTLASVFILHYIVKTSKKFSIGQIIILISLNCYFIFNALVYMHANAFDHVEFVKSYLLTVVFLFVYITSLNNYNYRIDKSLIETSLKYSAYFVFAFEIVQIIEQLLLGSTSSWFLLDGISISTADDIGRFEAVNLLGFFRPVSFFHEPSYMAMILFTILLILYNQSAVDKKLYATLVVGILLSMSSLVTLMLGIFLIINFTSESKKIVMIFLCIFFPILIYLFQEDISLIFRFAEILDEGTSGYVRLVEPFIITKNYISSNPLGIPLGQSDVVFNNSLFLIPLYFGIFAPVLVLCLLIYTCNKIKKNTKKINYLLCLICLMLVNGAIFTIESAFIALFINTIFFNRNEIKLNGNKNL